MYSQVFIIFRIEASVHGPFCYAKLRIYRIFYDLFFSFAYSSMPLILMIIIGLNSVHHFHQGRTRIYPLTANRVNLYDNR